MKRKPDLLWILVVILSLGVVTSDYTKSLLKRSSADTVPSAYEAQTTLTLHTTADR